MAKIKPCPFCGGEVDIRIHNTNYKDLKAAVVECPQCGAHGRAFSCELFDDESIYTAQTRAIKWWNDVYGGEHDKD